VILQPWKAENEVERGWCDVEFDDIGVISSDVELKSDHRDC